MKTDRSIDWLSITIPFDKNWRNFIPFPKLRYGGKGRHGYRQLWIDDRTGARIETLADREDMGHHLTLSGDVLRAMRDDLGAVDDKIIERIGQWDGKCSRIDLAIDCYGASFNPDTLNEALKSGYAKMPARMWRYIDGHASGFNGATIDTGSAKSDRRFRFYDKLAEQRIKDGEAWVRLELQMRRLYAVSALGLCSQDGVQNAVASLIGSYLTWEDVEYQEALIGATGRYGRVLRRQSNRQRWLSGQVAKALAAEIIIMPEFRATFNCAVDEFYNELLDKLRNSAQA